MSTSTSMELLTRVVMGHTIHTPISTLITLLATLDIQATMEATMLTYLTIRVATDLPSSPTL